MNGVLKSARFGELDTTTLYKILQLRSNVFVVEQNCIYPDADGRDLEQDAMHVWVEEDGAVVSVLRVLRESDGSSRIGRVCTSEQGRGKGYAAQLIRHVLDSTSGEISAHCQAYLKAWYESLGFESVGEEFMEDEIPHIPMRVKR